VRHKEELAGALVRVLQSTGKAKVKRVLAMEDVGRVGEGKTGAAWGAVGMAVGLGWASWVGTAKTARVGWDGVDELGWDELAWVGLCWDGMGWKG